jgi:hypothetical protein
MDRWIDYDPLAPILAHLILDQILYDPIRGGSGIPFTASEASCIP